MVRPAKGLFSSKGAMVAGLVQDIVPPKVRLPPRSLTGTRLSRASASSGPAKRTSTPPSSIHLRSRARSTGDRTTRSVTNMTDSGRCSRSAIGPLRTSV